MALKNLNGLLFIMNRTLTMINGNFFRSAAFSAKIADPLTTTRVLHAFNAFLQDFARIFPLVSYKREKKACR